MSLNFRFNYDALLFLGRSGAGKTTLVKKILSNVPRSRLYVIDSNYEFHGSNITRPTAYTSEWLDDYIKKFRAVHSNCLLYIEDIDLFQPLRSIELKRLAINGRHQNIGLILVSRRPKELPKVVISKCRYCFIFAGLVPEDKEYLESINGNLTDSQFPTEDFKYVVIPFN